MKEKKKEELTINQNKQARNHKKRMGNSMRLTKNNLDVKQMKIFFYHFINKERKQKYKYK